MQALAPKQNQPKNNKPLHPVQPDVQGFLEKTGPNFLPTPLRKKKDPNGELLNEKPVGENPVNEYDRSEIFKHDFSNILLFNNKCIQNLQAKLTLNNPGDKYEREADLVADQIVNNRDQGLYAHHLPKPSQLPFSNLNRSVNSIQHRQNETVNHSQQILPSIVYKALSSPGHRLDAQSRDFMEPRFGQNFEQVIIHTGAIATQAAQAINAYAFTVGSDIVFNANQFNTGTQTGQRLLAHELTHVIQQRSISTANPSVMRAGRTFGGFFANIFKFWDYSKEALTSYLKILEKTDEIEGDDNSDDKARQVVKEWKTDKGNYNLSPRTRVLLVREMLDGVVFGSDQDGIIDLLEGSKNTELAEMFKAPPKGLTYKEIHDRFGSRKEKLELFNERVLSNLDKLKSPDAKDAKSIEQRLGDVEKSQGIGFKDLSISFQLAPGTLYKSFKVNVVVPENGMRVTITLTKSSLQIRMQPSLFIDVVWPLSNAEMSGFTLTFAGLKPTLNIEGNGLVSGIAQEKVTEKLKGLLAGTRFEEAAYDPVKDPNLVSELADNSIIGDINRVKFNLEKNIDKSSGDSKVPQDVSSLNYSLNLVHTTGLPLPASGTGVVINAGTKFNLSIQTSGTAAALMKKDSHLEKLKIESDGIFIYKDKVKIAGLKSIQMNRGLDITLGGVETFVDIKELAKKESPNWAKGIVDKATGLMKSYDEAVDTVNGILSLFGNPQPKSDVAKDLAIKLAETYLSGMVYKMLSEYRGKIQSALSITDKQLEEFFGIGED